MSDNIFGHIFRARSLAYKTDEYGELQEFKKRVKQEIDGLNDCINPKFIMFKVTNKCAKNTKFTQIFLSAPSIT